MEKRQERRISHILSLVLGILSTVSTLFWYLSLPTGITAIVLGARSYKKHGEKLGLAGMIVGIVGVSICVFLYVSFLIILILENAS